jgi:membrane protein implicated in regulation of membrane protease activity
MRLFGFICLIGGASLIALFILHHLIKLLISGSLLLVKMGLLLEVIGFLLLALASVAEKKRKSAVSEVEKK